jgi:hypothetical protein
LIQHIKPAGICLMAYGGFNLLVLLAVGVLLGGVSGLLAFIGVSSGDEEAMVVGGIYGVVTLFVVVIGALPAVGCLASGTGVLMGKSWARLAAIIFGALSLMNLPLGTIVGLYVIFTMIDKDVAAKFAGEEL